MSALSEHRATTRLVRYRCHRCGYFARLFGPYADDRLTDLIFTHHRRCAARRELP
jgi:hypothetical protein